MKRSRCWVFTLNNPTEKDVAQMHTIFQNLCTDFAAQEELGVRDLTPHIQGYLYFKNARTFMNMKKLLPRAHIEVARKAIAARQYCLKKDTRCGRQWTPFNVQNQWVKPTWDEFKEQAFKFWNDKYDRKELYWQANAKCNPDR